MTVLLICAVVSIYATFVNSQQPTFAPWSHNQLRRFTCVIKEEGNEAVCRVALQMDFHSEAAISTANGEGCFTEYSEKGIKAVYCPVFCTEAMTAYLISKRPAANNKCIQNFSYKMKQYNGEWYLWRSGKCLKTEIQFDVGCLFDYPESSAKDLRVYLEKKILKNQN